MATRLKPVDVVIIGMGWVGSIAAKELAATGLKVVGLERGMMLNTVPDFQGPGIHDELRFAVRHASSQDTGRETWTFRNTRTQTALPVRRLASFLPGEGVGGSGYHWNGQHWRYGASDFVLRSHIEQRYGKKFIDPDLSIQDWGVTYAELEPHFDRFEYLCGTCGTAGNVKGEKRPGGNPFEAPRSREYPNPPMKETYNGALFRKAASSLGYHPFPQPSDNLSRAYVNPDGMQLQACHFCGYCERFGCEHYAKASPQTTVLPVALRNPNFELRTSCQALRVELDSTKTHATGVTYADAAGHEVVQPAELVIVSMFAINNPHMLLVSGIGTPYDPVTRKGTIGRNYAYQTASGVTVFYDEDVNINAFMASGANGTCIDDFGADSFDHGPHGFVGGAYIGAIMTNARPIGWHPTPPGTPRWGQAWKDAVIRHYNHTVSLFVSGSSMSSYNNYIDLDPTYRNAWGQPLSRLTFDFPDNDVRMSAYVTAKAAEIGRAMGGKQVAAAPRKGPYDIRVYQTTHCVGGCIMGTDPTTSAVNRYLQSWDVPNVFVIGASAYPQNSYYNPTGTLGALIYWSLDAIKSKYLKAPGALVSA